jgi:hypothetical protein
MQPLHLKPRPLDARRRQDFAFGICVLPMAAKAGQALPDMPPDPDFATF